MLIRIYILALYFSTYYILCFAFPVTLKSDESQINGKLLSNSALGVIACLLSTVCLILTLSICVCCRKNKYFKWPRRHPRRVLRSNLRNGIGGGHEISIFPPPGIDEYLSSSTSNIYFEPLPDITSHLSERNHSSRLSNSDTSNLNEDWFAEPFKNFPRNQLQYVRKLGSGWFGQVLEGRAIGIDTDHTSTVITKGISAKSTPVVVKALREDASAREQAFFLQELIPYRDVNHENVLKIVAYCLEAQPLLVLLQFCSKGDLKGVLKRETTITEINLLKMAKDAASGLAHMHDHNFIHTDLAARNCLVEDNMTVKIGDYGYSLQLYQDEYYLAENVALPLRWCAPESLHCTETTIEARELTSSANVWSFGVLLWEILSRGSLPYEDLDEDGVIQKVILDKTHVLQVPQNLFSSQTKLTEILYYCFGHVEKRPKMQIIHDHLSNLITSLAEATAQEFEGRWRELEPCQESLPQIQQKEHSIAIESRTLELNRFESDFSSHNETLQSSCSPSASLKNLHGSAEDLESRIAAKFGSSLPSWLGLEPGQPMDSFTEEISDAIQRLDEALSEDRSESSTNFSSPEKGSVNFILGKNSLVLNPPLTARTLSDEENLTLRLEQGDFSELVRLKSQSVQDFMRLTVVDEGSDSSDKASQPGSYIGEFPVLNHHHHPAQDKCFSSESNLKEALRDANFMVELEKLQAEHKFSIISEVSREGMSSFEDGNRHSETYEDFKKEEVGDYNQNSFLGNNFPPPLEEEGIKLENSIHNLQSPLLLSNQRDKEEIKLDVIEAKVDASPDCIVSSREILPSAPLPDVVAHDGNVNLKTSSDSSVDEEFKDLEKVVKEELVNERNKNIPPITEKFKESDLITKLSLELSGNIETFNNKQDVNSKCITDTDVVLGQDVIIGALNDYSLELYKPAKSTVGIDANLNKDITVEPRLVDNNGHIDKVAQNIVISESLHKEEMVTHSESIKTDKKDLRLSNNSVLQTTDLGNRVESSKLYNLSHDKYIENKDKFLSEFLPNSEGDANTDKPVIGILNNNNKIDSPALCDSELTSDDSKLKNGVQSNIVSESSQNLFANDRDQCGIAEKDKHLESGEFWELQMAAWQEAAEQTRELLYEAVNPPDSDDVLDEISKSPDSEPSPLKSPLFSSSDRLDDDSDYSDRENNLKDTYVSYGVDTDDNVQYNTKDENVRYNTEDLNALRSELNLKLGSVNETSASSFTEVESENDFVFINYKNSCPSTLSPIRETASEYEQYPSSESSAEFAVANEQSQDYGKIYEADLPEDISPTHLKLSLPVDNIENNCDFSSEEAKDSLILEDLEYDGSPTTATVIGPIAPMSDSSEDLLLVDTATNEAKLIGSGRPQSHIAFLVGEEVQSGLKDKDNKSRFLPDNNENKFEDDVDFESLPYEDTSGQFSSLSKLQGKTVDNSDQAFDGNIEETDAPHYQSYFTSALTSVTHPTPSLDGNDAFESAEHISLPYDVNLEVLAPQKEKVSKGKKFADSESAQIPSDSVKESIISDAFKSKEDSFVTLSFLGRLYNNAENTEDVQHLASYNSLVDGSQHSSLEHFYSTKSEEDSSDNEDIEEELPPECETLQRNSEDEPTPLRTPSHLTDFVWRSESDERYTPEWESDSEEGEANDEMESSSTSGEFIWQPGDPNVTHVAGTCFPSTDQTSLEWEVANEGKNETEGEKVSASPPESGLAEEVDEGEEDSESGEEEFTPSTWNSELTPNRSLLKSPETNSLQSNKKSVHWKRQRHHRVYEYPPEPYSWHAEVTAPTPRRSWNSTHSLDYLTLADWEIGGDEFLDDNSDDFEEYYPKGRPSLNTPKVFTLQPFAYDKTHEDIFSDSCEFFMGSPGTPYAFTQSSFTPAEFFPCQNTNDFEFLEPVTSNTKETNEEKIDYLNTENKPNPEEAKLSREKLRLDLPTLCLAQPLQQSPVQED